MIVSALRNELNQAFVILRSIALGRDLKKFLMVCLCSNSLLYTFELREQYDIVVA